jgi:heat-inducible transcriptional repressor
MLSQRQAALLKLIIGEYVSTAEPVGSKSIADKYRLGYSSATIRNEMADLEGAGYITHPHTSAGRVPSDRGYRYYVETMDAEQVLPDAIQRTIRHQFHQVEMEIEEWARLAASVLARVVQNATLVTLPKSPDVRLHRVELVELHESLAMLILVLREARVKQHMVSLPIPADQRLLYEVSGRLNSLIAGAGASEVERVLRDADLNPIEHQVLTATLKSLQSFAKAGSDEVNVAGLPDVLSQPEFRGKDRARELAGVFSRPGPLADALGALVGDESFQVIIGAENSDSDMKDLSVVLANYGLPGEMSGLIGVLGPTRMSYDRAIPTVRFLSSLMTELVREVHG